MTKEQIECEGVFKGYLLVDKEDIEDSMEELLSKIKSALGITGAYQDETLKIYIDEVKDYMLSAGVTQSVVDSPKSVGCIARGVIDMWTYQSGTAKFSEYFNQRLIQLSMKKGASNV